MDFSQLIGNLTGKMTAESSWFTIAAKGGILMVVLLVVSIIAITIIIERLIKFRRARLDKAEFFKELHGYIADNQIERAIQFCEEKERSPLAKIVALAIENYEVGVSKRREIIELALRKEMRKFEKNLGALSTFAAIAPLIGFLGTVTGMVKVFMKIAETGGGVDISVLATGIWEALVTTIGGLTVGIISILFYNYLVGRVENIAYEIDDITNDFLTDFRRIKYGK
ncbi:MAG: MotA/TolQ/ExbB proton channel family protein [Candidatus Cloacimonetes bacterium]|nr:MotA/TolQ/ExbB proton channel family protein [Candidatus Cloacimonadota bacterium]